MNLREGPGVNLGAHVSIAGGLHKAVERAAALDATALQIFTRNQVRWKAKPLSEMECRRFRQARAESRIQGAIAHASYLINLASPDAALRRRSVQSLRVDYERSEALGLDALVFHPGSHMGSGEDAGLDRISDGVAGIMALTQGFRCRLLFETTAGQGDQLGHRFEEIARLLNGSDSPERLGFCLDTCHVFAAGYDLGDRPSFHALMRQIEASIGLRHLAAIHINDSRAPLGSRIDRHAHIGHGRIGLDGFRALMRDRRFRRIPKILETPKGTYRRRSWDRINLETLRGLTRQTRSTRPPARLSRRRAT